MISGNHWIKEIFMVDRGTPRSLNRRSPLVKPVLCIICYFYCEVTPPKYMQLSPICAWRPEALENSRKHSIIAWTEVLSPPENMRRSSTKHWWVIWSLAHLWWNLNCFTPIRVMRHILRYYIAIAKRNRYIGSPCLKPFAAGNASVCSPFTSME